MDDIRRRDSIEICAAYKEAEAAIRKVGKLLRTTEAGQYMWSAEHKSALTGMAATLVVLRHAVPRYTESE